MRRIVLAAPALPFVALPRGAEANALVRVDRATQAMNVSVDGSPVYHWPVSTASAPLGKARQGKATEGNAAHRAANTMRRMENLSRNL